MARGNKNLEWTMIDADMKSSYLKEGKVGNFLLYSFVRSTFGKVCLVILAIWLLSCLG